MKIIDLSLPIDDTVWEAHPVHIDRVGHLDGAGKINRFMMFKKLAGRIRYYFGKRVIPLNHLPNGDFLSLETVHAAVHIGTHVDFTWHYGSTCEGKPSKYIDELPLEWCMQNGVKLDFTHKKAGDTIDREDIQNALASIKYVLQPFDIVLIHTGADKAFGTSRYHHAHPGVTPQALQYILEFGVKIVGIDAMGFDRPYSFMMKEYFATNDPKHLWPAHFHGRTKEYAHIERLANLEKLPATGFQINCLPVRVRNTGAAWSRVVALIKE